MKFQLSIILQVASLALAQSRADVTEAEAAEICGVLGVMEVPEGVDPKTVRICKEHPTILEETEHSLSKRKCWYGPPDAGCSKSGWCYANCDNGGQGAWCWTTVGSPFDAWKSCGRDSDCNRNDSCGAGGCKKCGCGC